MNKILKAFLPSIVLALGWILLSLLGLAFSLFSGEFLQALEGVLVLSATAFLFIFLSVLWFIPTSIAAFRECRSYWGILVINFFPGLGHVVALVWALVEQKSQPVIVQNIYQPPPILDKNIQDEGIIRYDKMDRE